MNRTDRLLAIVLELQARGWRRAEDLASTFEVSKRTIYRDIEALCASGVPVTSLPGKGYSLVAGYFLPPLRFTADEAIILLLGCDIAAQHFDAPYRRTAHSAASKIAAALPDHLRQDVRELQQRLHFVAVTALDDPAQAALLQQLRRAVIECKTIRFVYHARHSDHIAGTTTTRDADPYALVHYDRAWYAIAHCHLRQALRLFRLERIDSLTVLDTPFTRPPNFDPASIQRDDRTLTVRALFDPAIARWVRESRPFYATAEEPHPEGLLITFRVRHETDILAWLLSWGTHVRVLEPATLRQRIAEAAAALLRHHAPPE